LTELKGYLEERKAEYANRKKHSEMGINIQSILHEQMYHNVILEERIMMFENYLNTFNTHHSKYFSRLTIKLKLMLGIVNEDFHLKKTKSLQSKRHNCSVTDTISESSYSSTESTTPKTSMTDSEENNVRLLIGDATSNKEIQLELNTILRHIPQEEAETMENKSFRATIMADV
jgi:hypothetical protein